LKDFISDVEVYDLLNTEDVQASRSRIEFDSCTFL
jgi:hypothetical protein